jgi:putative phosphoesterase
MIIGVVSDTHGHEHYTRQAIRMLESLQVDRVIHCGDIGSPAIPPMFAAWPADFVFGNVDGNRAELQQAIEDQPGHHCHGRVARITLDQTTITFLHGDDSIRLEEACNNPLNDLVCCGHTHQSDCRTNGTTLILNPGAIYRASPRSLAIVDLSSMDATIIALSD